MKTLDIGIGMALVLMGGNASIGDTIAEGVGTLGVMDDGIGHSRILFTLSGLTDASQEGNLVVGRASLVVTLSGEPENRSLPLRIYPVTSPWAPGDVDWWSGWESPGGDVDRELYSRAEVNLSQGPSVATFDITILVKEIVEDGQPFEGFLLTLDPEIGVGLPSEDLERFQGLSSAVLEMDALTIGSLPQSIADEVRSPARMHLVVPDFTGR